MSREEGSRFVVLVTGHAGAGKSTLGPRIADALDAVLISRDEIHYRLFDGWEPSHPATVGKYDPEVNGNTFSEGRVSWSLFLWMIEQVAQKVSVVAESPFNHQWNRDMFEQTRLRLSVPIVEVALVGDRDALLDRVRRRAQAADAHPIKRLAVVGAERLSQSPYQPVMEVGRVIEVDTTDLDSVDVSQIASGVRALLATSRSPGS